MTARIDSPIGSSSIDGTPISSTDLARIAAEEELHAKQQRNAVLVVAGGAQDVEDCRMLLAMLGLTDDIVAAARAHAPTPPKPSRKGRAAA
jgi:hypothetical protein